MAVTGLTIEVCITSSGFRLLSAADRGTFKPSVWFELGSDDVVNVCVPNSEMGQGVRTALSMMIADELEADWNRIRVVQAPTANEFKNRLYGSQLTLGSASVRGFYEPLRKAGAAGRTMLVMAAARTWNVSEEDCEASKGIVRHRNSGREVTYGKISVKAALLPIPQNPPLKTEAEYRYIGKPIPRLDIPEKVAGRAVFGIDVNVPDMLYAVLARPPAYRNRLHMTRGGRGDTRRPQSGRDAQ
jgi:isoquinoline 1-oxidoreductase beta subunit